MDNLVGQVLKGRYQLTSVLGRGGMGTVYEAMHLDLGRRVAIKVLFQHDHEALSRFRQEALAAAGIHHPNVVAVTDFDAGDRESPPFIAMELLQGSSLAGAITRFGPMPVARATAIAVQMLDALGAAHAAGIVHRDVKPANVFLVDLGGGGLLVKLLDFGIAKLVEEDNGVRTSPGSFLGTPAYAAPEQIFGAGQVDARTDLHAVSICLYEMLMGERPFKADATMDVATKILRVEAPRILRPDVPPALVEVVACGLAKAREARWPNAHAMTQALRPFVDASVTGRSGLSPLDSTLTPTHLAHTTTHAGVTPPRRSARSPWLLPLAIGIPLTVLAVGSVAAAVVVKQHLDAPEASVASDAGTPTTAPTAAATRTTELDAGAPGALTARLGPKPPTPVAKDAGAAPVVTDAGAPGPLVTDAGPPPPPAKLHDFKTIVIKRADPATGNAWLAKHRAPMRMTCLQKAPCHNWVMVTNVRANSTTHGPATFEEHCQGEGRWRVDECTRKYVKANPLPPAVCAPTEPGCEATLDMYFY